MAATRIAVVTDSTAYLPDGLAAKHDITVVPLQVVIGGRVGTEGRDVFPIDVAEALRGRRTTVSTSRPAPEALLSAYRAAADAGAQAVVSVHLSAELSGTVEAARLAAERAPLPVRVVDSRSTAMGLGFPVLAAAETAASDDADEDTVVAAATATAARTRVLFYVDTLEHLRRGGRIGAAAALLGSALAVKPILHVTEGRIAVLEKVRTSARAIDRLEELAVEATAGGPVDIAVHHLAAAERADQLATALRARVPGTHSMYVTEVGAVVGAHVGPGLLGVVVSRRTPHV